MSYKICNNFSICLRVKSYSFILEFLFQFLIVYYDSIMNQRDSFFIIKMRVRVFIRNLSTCGPPGVAYSDIALKMILFSFSQKSFNAINLSRRISNFINRKLSIINSRNTSRIISSI